MPADSVEPGPVEPGSIEPWLRGPLEGIHPLVAPTVYAYLQALEDLAHWTDGLSDAQIWSRPHGLAPVGFQLRHIAGSVERLTTYLRGEQLTSKQLEAARSEMLPGPGRAALLEMVTRSLLDSEQVIRSLDPATLTDARAVGRQQLPATVAGLVVHLAEHTQRHVGELIITAKLARMT
jgi:DinB superfamily